MSSVTITRLCDYQEVFTDQVQVPVALRDGLIWIQENCPRNEPTRVSLADLAYAWNVPELVISLGLQNLQRTGFFVYTQNAGESQTRPN